MFDQLITALEKVKSEKQITPEIAELITDHAIVANMISIEKKHGKMNEKEMFNLARFQVLNHFDNYLLSFSEKE